MTQEARMSKQREVENLRIKYEKIFRRIGKFKKYMSDICNHISNHTVKVAGLRDKNDEVAKCLDDFTKIEEFSTTSKLSMAVAAELVATVGDHQDLAVQRVETLVLPNLSSYARICDCIKADVWNAIQAIRREKRKKKYAKTLKRKSHDLKSKSCLNDAQRELDRASADATRLCQLSEEQVIKFEHKRLIDLKESLGTFVKIQIASYTKTLELLSETYKQIQSIDENGDLDILKASLKIGDCGTVRNKSAVLMQKKSLTGTGTSTKSSTSNVREKRSNGTAENRQSSSAEDISNDSSHSEVVRRLEKVLHSKQDIHKQERKQSNHEVPRESRYNRQERKLSCDDTRNVGGDERQNTNRTEKTKNYIDVRPNDGTMTNRNGRRRSEDQNVSIDKFSKGEKHTTHPNPKRQGGTYDDAEYFHMQSTTLGRRPSVPTRPITVPARRRSSTEDLSSRHDEFAFKFQSKKLPTSTTGHDIDRSYYYSQSEDEKCRFAGNSLGVAGRKQPCGLFRDSKQVTFCNPNNDNQREFIRHVGNGSWGTSTLSSNTKKYVGGRETGDNQESHERVLGMLGTTPSLKNYC